MDTLVNSTILNSEFILNSIQSPIIVINSTKKTIIYCNSATEDFLEKSNSSILNKNIKDIFKFNKDLILFIDKAIKNNRNFFLPNIEIDLIKNKINTSVNISKTDNEGELFTIILNDNSKKFEISKKFNFVKSAQSVSSLVSMLSHEIKNPLSGIKGAIEILHKNNVANKKDMKLYKLIDDETNRIKNLLNSLENFTDDRPIKKNRINLNKILRYAKNSVETIFKKKNITFIENYDPSLPEIYGNKDNLIQLFINLLTNSAEAIIDKNGRIKLITKFEQENFPIKVLIEDNGSGIPDKIKDNIFDAFITNKINGKGLGLSICAKIVEKHNALIEFDKINNKTIFTVMFNRINN